MWNRLDGVTVSFSDINSLRILPYATVMVDHSLQIWPQMHLCTVTVKCYHVWQEYAI